MDALRNIHAKLPNTRLVMQGSSSVPEEKQEIINRHGGIAPTFGVPLAEIEVGIRNGVRKVNIDTDLRLALTGAIRNVFATNPGEFDPRKYLAPGIDAMAAVWRHRFERFCSAGRASEIKAISLPQMAERYKLGDLS